MRVVLDTSAIIYLNDFRKFEEILTVQEVVDEVKDKISSIKLSSLKLKIVEPSEKVLGEIKDAARESGDLEKLSETDLKVLAAARESNSEIISDDRNVQNVAEKLGIKYVSVFNKKITRLITWKNYCKNCKKFFDKKNCPICGSKLTRVPRKSVELKNGKGYEKEQGQQE
jgi:UPF0271 protein